MGSITIDSTIPGYKLASTTENYAGIEQRWLVVQSQERRESDLGKLTQKITKAESKAVQDLKKLSLLNLLVKQMLSRHYQNYQNNSNITKLRKFW